MSGGGEHTRGGAHRAEHIRQLKFVPGGGGTARRVCKSRTVPSLQVARNKRHHEVLELAGRKGRHATDLMVTLGTSIRPVRSSPGVAQELEAGHRGGKRCPRAVAAGSTADFCALDAGQQSPTSVVFIFPQRTPVPFLVLRSSASRSP